MTTTSAANSNTNTKLSFIDTLYKEVVSTVRLSNQLPRTADDYSYITSISPHIKKELHNTSQRVLELIHSVQQYIQPHVSNEFTSNTLFTRPSVDVRRADVRTDERHHSISTSVDCACEQIDLLLDKHMQQQKQLHSSNADISSNGGHNSNNNGKHSSSSSNSKPQDQWKHTFNNDYLPWFPIIQHKYHAIKPLDHYTTLKQRIVQDMKHAADNKKSALIPSLNQHMKDISLLDSYHWSQH